jgi:hypothetical protein
MLTMPVSSTLTNAVAGDGGPLLPGACRITHGPCDSYFENLAGKSVASIQRSLATAFDLPNDAEPYIGGSVVAPDYRVRAGDEVVFVRSGWGRKGVLEPEEIERLDAVLHAVNQVEDRLAALEKAVALLVSQRTVKEWYTTTDIAAMFNKAEYTVREWCRLCRINASKIPSLRGGEQEWRISHAELVRYQNEGLLPIPTKY